MFELMDKKIITIICLEFSISGPMLLYSHIVRILISFRIKTGLDAQNF